MGGTGDIYCSGGTKVGLSVRQANAQTSEGILRGFFKIGEGFGVGFLGSGLMSLPYVEPPRRQDNTAVDPSRGIDNSVTTLDDGPAPCIKPCPN